MKQYVALQKRVLRRGVSLLEILAVVTVLGVLASLAVSRFVATSGAGAKNACYVNKEEIAIQAQLWFRNKGAWPAANLSDIGADTVYFPAGLPSCPVDGSSYTFDQTEHEVTGHSH